MISSVCWIGDVNWLSRQIGGLEDRSIRRLKNATNEVMCAEKR